MNHRWGKKGLTVGEEPRAERELPLEHLDLAPLLLEAADAGVHVRRRRAVLALPHGLGGEVPQIQAQIGAHPDLHDVEPHRRDESVYGGVVCAGRKKCAGGGWERREVVEGELHL